MLESPGSSTLVRSLLAAIASTGSDSSGCDFDGEHYSIAGVMPTNSSSQLGAVWVPRWTARIARSRNHNYLVIARLKPAVDIRQAQAELSAISTRSSSSIRR